MKSNSTMQHARMMLCQASHPLALCVGSSSQLAHTISRSQNQHSIEQFGAEVARQVILGGEQARRSRRSAGGAGQEAAAATLRQERTPVHDHLTA
jgi:hypothetical protein